MGDLMPGSSWAAPLALAHLIHLQEVAWASGAPSMGAQELLGAARGGRDGDTPDEAIKAIDPLRNGQFTIITPR
jgi:hypothetical protein